MLAVGRLSKNCPKTGLLTAANKPAPTTSQQLWYGSNNKPRIMGGNNKPAGEKFSPARATCSFCPVSCNVLLCNDNNNKPAPTTSQQLWEGTTASQDCGRGQQQANNCGMGQQQASGRENIPSTGNLFLLCRVMCFFATTTTTNQLPQQANNFWEGTTTSQDIWEATTSQWERKFPQHDRQQKPRPTNQLPQQANYCGMGATTSQGLWEGTTSQLLSFVQYRIMCCFATTTITTAAKRSIVVLHFNCWVG